MDEIHKVARLRTKFNIQNVPLATEPGICLIILPLMRILQHYRHIPLHFSHNERSPAQISLQYLHWCYNY